MCKPASGPEEMKPEASALRREIKLMGAVAGLYASFIVWGVLQERITSLSYTSEDGAREGKWTYPLALNACMALASLLASGLVLLLVPPSTPQPPSSSFWKPALTCTLASPFGYAALAYINYPLLLLSKSCKLVPVMLMGRVLRGVRYRTGEYIAVALITVGVVLFSLQPSDMKAADKAKDPVSSDGYGRELIGLALVMVNLLLDGVTNSMQDEINSRGNVSPIYMMFQVNVWIAIFHAIGLAVGAAAFGGASELFAAIAFCRDFPAVVPNVALFCACAATGQLFIFYIIKEFGSLVNVTCTITRKFFSILVSVAFFGHPMASWQWLGVLAVFAGLAQSVAGKYTSKKGGKKASSVAAAAAANGKDAAAVKKEQ